MYFIKRIIGLPGETVQILDGYVYIDGRYRVLVFFWRMIPRWLWERLPITN